MSSSGSPSGPAAATGRAATTRALGAVCRGNGEAQQQLSSLVYVELRRMAAGLLRRERADHTLQATALVHEAWLRLVDETAFQETQKGVARHEFLRHAVQAMRRVLIDHARSRQRDKRGGDRQRVPLAESAVFQFDDADELLDLDAAVQELAEHRPRLAQIAELRIFGGLSVDETAGIVDVSLSTAKAEWALAKALLTQRVRGRQAD